MEHLYRKVLCASLALVLCSCASQGGYRSSLSADANASSGTTLSPGMNLSDPHFYMNDWEMAPVLLWNPSGFERPSDMR